MPYTGDVTVGGPPDVRELPGLEITKVEVGPYENNAYLLRCAETGELLLIDAANQADRLLELIGDRTLARIVTTHRHQDHWQALSAIVAATQAPVVAHSRDADALPVTVAEKVEHGDLVRFGQISLEVLHLRGHTPGSIALLHPSDGGHLWTGDCLFPGGVGNTWGDPKLFERLITDVVDRVFDRLPDTTWVYPGHGKDTTLGRERPSLGEWRKRGW